jgi:hypothetical protein
MKRPALYVRVSTVDQHPETQLHDLRQFAAQRGLQIVTTDLIPSDTKEMESRLQTLAAYGTDVLIVVGGQKISLCRRGSGFDAAKLDYLIRKRTEYYARRQRDRALMKGDRLGSSAAGSWWSSTVTRQKFTRCYGTGSCQRCGARTLPGIGRTAAGGEVPAP